MKFYHTNSCKTQYQDQNEPLLLDLFGNQDRLPRRPYCTDDLSTGLRIRDLRQAITKPYIQINPPHLRIWSIFDVDRSGGGLAWETADLPPPNFTTMNRENGHAHLVWGLSAPVLMAGNGVHDKPMRYLAGIESLMREKLQADLGYAGLITKNPVHPLWRTYQGPRWFYDLGFLAEWLPDLEKYVPKRGKVQEYGTGRNCTLFDWLRAYAYRAIRGYWKEGSVRWLEVLNYRALERNAEFRVPLHAGEVKHIVRSVHKYTWEKFTPERFSAWQTKQGAKSKNQAAIAVAGGVASGLARARASEDRRSTACLMRAKGMSLRDIAAKLGVPKSTVHDWLSV
ncbi:MAG: replication initiation protein [Betaproteobacteria bacterium]|nr:replication initiation protein [Betaproteobacteria bacterium]